MSLVVLTWFLCDLRRVSAFATEHREFSYIHDPEVASITRPAHPFNCSTIFVNLFVHFAQHFIPHTEISSLVLVNSHNDTMYIDEEASFSFALSC